MTQVGTDNHTYELIRDFLKLPNGESFGLVSRRSWTDRQDRVYVFQRKDPPVVVFDQAGNYLGAWGSGEVTDPHGLKKLSTTSSTPPIAPASVAKSFTLDGKPLLELGQRGVHSGHRLHRLPLARANAPRSQFNHPTEMIAHPNGDIYVTDGCTATPVCTATPATAGWRHVMGHAGQGATGEFQTTCRTASRSDPEGSATWPTEQTSASRFFPRRRLPRHVDRHGPGPNDITRSQDGTFTIAEQEDGTTIPRMSACATRGKSARPHAESRHVHGVGVDSHGDIYAGLSGGPQRGQVSVRKS